MHIAIALGLAVVASLFLIVVIGATPFLAIPIFALAAGLVALLGVITRRQSQRKLDTDVPSTREASYTPVVDPAERD